MSAYILGIEELEKEFKKLSELDQNQAIGKATEFVRSSAKGLVHVSPFGSGGELRDSIFSEVNRGMNVVQGIVYTDKEYAEYVEYGTGRVGAENHAGISPNVNPTYTMDAWWVHESQVDEASAVGYGWFSVQTEDGKFYRINGNPAYPYMYPALKDNEDAVLDIIREEIKKAL